MNARNKLGWRAVIAVAMIGFGIFGVPNVSAALLFMEWADTPGVDSKTLSVGESATINIRLDLIAGESWGSADVPLGVGTWIAPDDIPNFEITGFQADGFIGPSHSYDRSGLPALPMSPEEYRLTTTYDGITPIDGPASIILDQLSIEALSVGHDDIVFGESVLQDNQLVDDRFLFGSDGQEWRYLLAGPILPPSPNEWTEGIGGPGTIPIDDRDPFVAPFPLVLEIIPEPSSLLILFFAILYHSGRHRR